MFSLIRQLYFLIGNTERSILENVTNIVDQSLPLEKVISYYKEVKGASRDVVLGYVTFTNAGKNVSYPLFQFDFLITCCLIIN